MWGATIDNHEWGKSGTSVDVIVMRELEEVHELGPPVS